MTINGYFRSKDILKFYLSLKTFKNLNKNNNFNLTNKEIINNLNLFEPVKINNTFKSNQKKK